MLPMLPADRFSPEPQPAAAPPPVEAPALRAVVRRRTPALPALPSPPSDRRNRIKRQVAAILAALASLSALAALTAF